MKYNKKTKISEQNLKHRSHFSLLLKYRHNHFYSEKEDFQDHKSQEVLEELDEQASELAKRLEEAMTKIEQVEEKTRRNLKKK